MYLLLKLIIIVSIVLFIFTFIISVFRYLNSVFKYGTKGDIFIGGMRLYGLVPKAQNKRYTQYRMLFLAAGWNISVELFYIIKCSIVFGILTISLLVSFTNNKTKLVNLEKNLNHGRSMIEQPIEITDSLIEEEKNVLIRLQKHLMSIGLTPDPDDPLAFEETVAFLESEGVNYDTINILSRRLLTKINDISKIEKNDFQLLVILLLSMGGYFIPNILLAIKLELVRNNKDWQLLNCLTTYSVMGRLPPYRVDTVIESMQDVSNIYNRYFEEFKDVLYRNNERELENIIMETADEDLSQIFETLVLGSEIGVQNTVDNIDDMIDIKIKWLGVNAQNKRQKKFMIAFIPVGIVLMLLYIYALQGLSVLNQLMIIDF